MKRLNARLKDDPEFAAQHAIDRAERMKIINAKPLRRAHGDPVQDSIILQLVRLIELCEQHDLDLDLMLNTAQHLYDGDADSIT